MTNKDNGGPASDRELLEMAAKAAGHSEVSFEDGVEARINGWWAPWNPLENDGDALRLSVEIGIGIDIKRVSSRVCAYLRPEIMAVEVGEDMATATRRAIVRAAVAIGSAM